MLLRVVEAVLVVSDDLACVDPRSQRRVGFGVPDFSQQRRAERLQNDRHPALAVFVPVDRPAMRRNSLAGFDILQMDQPFVRLRSFFCWISF